MLVGYFDESGVHDSSKVVCIGGLVGSLLQWARLEKPWAEQLAVTRVSHFHAAKCEAGGDEYFGISRGLRDSLVTGLTNEIADRALFVLVAALRKDDWDVYASAELKKRFQTPYHFCFESILDFVQAWSEKRMDGEPVAVVFAEHREFKSRAAQMYELYRADKAYKMSWSADVR